MSKPRRFPHLLGRRARRARLAIERLEDRTLLAGSNVFAQFLGVVPAAGQTDQIPITLSTSSFTIPGSKAVIGFQVVEAAGSPLDPAAVTITTSSGTAVTPTYVNADLAGDTQSLALASLPYGSYNLAVGGDDGTSGAFQLNAFLVGDANGDHRIDLSDGSLIRSIYGSVAGDGHYLVAADANLDGMISSFDYTEWRYNVGVATTIAPLTLALQTPPGVMTLSSGALATSNPTVTLGGTTEPGASVALETGTDGNFDEGSTTADPSGHFSFSVGLTAGANDLQVRASDAFGQQQTSALAVLLDTQAPTIAITSPAPGLVTNANPTLTGTVTDNLVGVASLQAAVDGGAYAPVTFNTAGHFSVTTSLPLDHSADGSHTVHFVATDLVGNVSPITNFAFTLDTTPPAVTITGPSPGLTVNHDVTITGRATDALSGLASVQAGLDGSAYSAVSFQPDGTFSLPLSLPLNGSADGSHTVHFRATDLAGNVSPITDFGFTLDTTPPVVTITSPAPGLSTSQNITITGQVADALSGVASAESALDGGAYTPLSFDAAGHFSLTTSLSLDDTADGPHTIHFRATDRAGNVSVPTDFTFTLEVCIGFGNAVVGQSGGSAAGMGTVTINGCDATLREGDSFDVTLSQSITIPAQAETLSFDYGNLAFDTTSQGSVKDAFEVALVDASGHSLVPTYAASRDAFLNVSEGQPAALGAWATSAAQTVTLDISHVTPGTAATLVFRLVNNDGDTNTTVAVGSVRTAALTGPAVAPGGQPSAPSSQSVATIEFAHLADVSASIQPVYGRTSYDEPNSVLYADLAAENAGTYFIDSPLIVAIDHLSDPTVRVQGSDGTTPDGLPYFDLSSLVPGGKLTAGASTGSRTSLFYDPGGVSFTYDLVFLAQLNRPPQFASQPNTEALVGMPYVYHAKASDPENDPLTFSLLSGPAGMTVNATTGAVTWLPASPDVGNAAIALKVDDGHGGSAEQDFTLSVINPPPDRPPVFGTSPVVDGSVDTPYTYQAQATDPDSDPLTYSVFSGPAGLTIDPTSGLVQWSPTVAQIGTDSVTLQVSDGRGGTAVQPYTIDVRQQAGNDPPTIISDPVTHYNQAPPGNPASGNEDPQGIQVILNPGQTIDQTVSLFGPPAGTPITLGATVTAALTSPGEQDRYGFTLPADSLLYFDSLTDNSRLQWSLSGGGGTPVNDRPFNASDASGGPPDPVLSLPAGSYTVTASSLDQLIGAYSFRLLDLSAATTIESGTTVSGALAPASSTDTYRFAASAGDTYYFASLTGFFYGADDWRLIDPYGDVLFASSLLGDGGRLTLPATGEYTLLIEGSVGDTGTRGYAFDVAPVADTTQPLALGATESAALADPGELDHYTFTLPAAGLFYFDSLTDNSGLQWSLNGLDGMPVSDRSFTTSDAGSGPADPVLSLPAGNYTLTVSGTGATTGGYSFRLLDLSAAATIEPGTPVSGTLAPASRTDMYRFTASAGDSYDFASLTGFFYGADYWRLIDPYGDVLFTTTLNADGGRLTLAAAGEYTLLIEGNVGDTGTRDYSFNAAFLGNVPPPPPVGTPLTLGGTINGTLSTPGEQDPYIFTLPAAGLFYFDALTDDAGLQWSLSGPDGTPVSDLSFTSSDGYPGPQDPVLSLPAGNYTLTVSGSGSTTESYSFRLLDLSAAATIEPGTPVNGTLAPANSTDLYRFAASAGASYYFASLSPNDASGDWRLIDPYGDVLFTSIELLGDGGRLTLPATGEYTLLIEGRIYDTGTTGYSFNVAPVADTTQSMTVGATVNGTLAGPGELDHYTFTLPAAGRFYFDALTDDAGLQWSLSGPDGTPVSDESFTTSDGQYGPQDPVLSLPAGNYTLTVSGVGQATGAYAFRLLDLSAGAPLTPGVAVSSTLSPGNSTAVYRFTVSAGDSYDFAALQSSSNQTTWRLIDPTGGVQFTDGQGQDVGSITLQGGTYTLLVEGYIGETAPVTYSFNVQPELADLLPSDPTVLFKNLTGPAETPRFDVQFTGDGQPHVFDLKFVLTHEVLGSIPVSLNAGYLYQVRAVDPDGDPLHYSLTTAPAGMTIDPQTGTIRWPATPSNLLQNPSFETIAAPQTGQGLLPVGWVSASSSPDTFSTDGSFGLAPGDFGWWASAPSAEDGLRWVAGEGAGDSADQSVDEGIAQVLATPLVTGVNYDLSGYIRQGDRSDLANPGGYDVWLASGPSLADPRVRVARLAPTSDSQDWAYRSAVFQVPTGLGFTPTAVIFVPYAADPSADTYIGLDNVSLVGPPAPAAVTVRVDDGQGGYDTQSFTVSVNQQGAGGIQGTIFNDLNGDGARDSGTTSPAPPALSNLEGTTDPYLAGMPDGSTASGGDVAPAQSPLPVPGLTLSGGSALMVTVLAGSVNNVQSNADGEFSPFTAHTNGAENGISSIVAPANSLVGVFLGPDQPDGAAAPPTLDFSPSGTVPGGIDYTTISPLLQQVFFIGDGRTSSGQIQQIIVPDGATRLYLGVMSSGATSGSFGSFAVAVQPYSPANAPGLLSATPVSDLVAGYGADAGVYALAYDEPRNSLLASDAFGDIYEVKPDGTSSLFATDPTPQFQVVELRLAVAQLGNLGGFEPGDVFTLYGTDRIDRITDGGRALTEAWVNLPGAGPPDGGALTFDDTGLFGGDLIAVTGAGGVWLIDAAGHSTLLTQLDESSFSNGLTEGISVLPDDSARYGPLAGCIIVGQNGTASNGVSEIGLWAITPQGKATFYDPGLGVSLDYLAGSVDAIGVVEPNANVFFDSRSGLGGAPASQLSTMVGDFFVAIEGYGLFRVFWNGHSLESQRFSSILGDFPPSEAIAFAPIAVSPLPPPIEPGTPNWTIYLDLNHDGKLDPNDPFTTTDATGHYAFANLPSGTYTVAEVGQPGWLETSPASGTYTVTVQAGQVTTGIDFGNTQINAPASRPTTIVSTPPPQATVGQLYRYDVAVDNPDGQTLTFDLPVHPAGMVVDPATGVVAWVPTADEVGSQTALLRLSDARGDVVLQDLNITVTAANTPLVIDLTISNVDQSGLVFDGQTLTVSGTISATVTDLGPSNLDRPVDVLFFEDRNGNNTYDPGTDNVLGTTMVTQPLAAGASTTVTASLSGHVLFTNNRIWAFVNSNQAFPETNENNNLAVRYSEFIPPVGQFDPVVEWNKSTFSVHPESNQVMTTPLVIDVNGDGIPDVIFTTFTGGNYGSGGVLRAISGDDGRELWSTTSPYDLDPTASLAVGDIDGDGEPEIIGLTSDQHLIAFHDDGTFMWLGDSVGFGEWGGASLADLYGAGKVEIIFGSKVFNSDGKLLWAGQGSGIGDGGGAGPLSAVADLDLDGVPEIIAGSTAYRADGSIYWQAPIPDGYVAVANFDGGPYPDVVEVSSGNLYLLAHDGTIKWGPVPIPGGGGGPPTVADMDGDGKPEIGVAGARFYTVFNSDGSVRWSQPTQDFSSAVTGSSVFDFDGDGKAEVVYGDELNLYIYDGSTGRILFQMPKGSGTAYELPVIADVDGSGKAEIVAAANDYYLGQQTGIFVIRDRNDTWVPSRGIWNEQTYHITNVNDDGTIPVHEQNSWQLYNSYRLNLQPDPLTRFAAPDLTASYVLVGQSNGQTTYTVRLGNGGSASAPAGVDVAFYDGDPRNGGVLLGTVASTQRLEPGSDQDLTLTVAAPAADLWVRADDDGTGRGSVSESDETNNLYHPDLGEPPFQTGEIDGTVLNSNHGSPLAGWNVYLDQNRNGIHDPGERVTVTDANGHFSFPNLDPGTYTVAEVGQPGWTATSPQSGSQTIILQSGQTLSGIEFGNAPLTVAPGNRPPSIVSRPGSQATVGHAYLYTPAVDNPDGRVLVFDLPIHPVGMSIDPTTGEMSWIPTTDEIGSQSVTVRVTDAIGQTATQSFKIAVTAVDVPSLITSEPPTQGAVGSPYSYAVLAQYTGSGALTYALTSAPAGMTIDPASGLIQWTPTADEVGSQAVALSATDPLGGTASQTFTVVVAATPPVQPPTITSQPTYAAEPGALYQYAVTAVDPAGLTLTYSLTAAPAGMSVDPSSGLVQWTPDSSQAGPNQVTVVATNAGGASASQSFAIVVAVNQSPAINPTAPTTITAGLTYRYDVKATDADGDPLTYTLVAGPSGMSIDALGRLTWPTGIADIGTHHVSIAVADNRGASVPRSFDVDVVADTQPPLVAVSVTPSPAGLGAPATFLVTAVDNVAVQSLTLTVDGVPILLDSSGRATITMTKAGDLAVVATATDPAGNVGTASSTLTVIDPSVNSPPTVSFDSPAGDDVITAPTPVIGTVSDNNLLFYTLSIAPLGSEAFTEIARGTSPVSDGTLGTFDPSLLSDGAYDLRLYAKNTGGYDSTIDETVNVAGNLKLGDFRLSFNDLTVPVAGIPITVTRTYDSLNAASSEDFGYGWTLDYRDADLRTSVAPTGAEADLIYTPFTMRTRVYVTLPGGQRQGFTFAPTLAPGFRGSFLGVYEPHFVPDAGVTSQLSVDNTELSLGPDGQFYSYVDGTPYNASSPAFGGVYTLSTKDGLSYTIDGDSGKLLTATDANGNTLTFSDSGIVSSAGPQVTFDRDPQGRIVAVTDPAGKEVQYQYDASGDLVAVTDRQGDTTQFLYDAPQAHYLTQVIDPLGHTGIRTDYDSQGRLISETDASGKSVGLSYDPTNSTEVVTDQLGNPTTYVYDDRGNIIKETDALGGVTTRTYDAANDVLTETDPLGRTTTDTYDAQGNVLTETDPLGHVTRHTYQTIQLYTNLRVPLAPMTLEATSTDALGDTTTNSYDGNGNLLSTTDPTGAATSFTYDASGNPTSITDANGGTTSFQYDAAGHLLQQTDALGHVTNYTYDADGNQLTQTTTLTTPSGVRTLVTSTTYDARGHVLTETDAEGNVTSYQYDKAGNKTAMIDALGHTTTYVYDDRGELTETINPDGTTTSTQYDAAGHVTAQVDERGRTTTFTYDALGRKVQTTNPDGTTTSTGYDAAGEVTARVDERGNRTSFQYDAAGNQTVVTDALGDTTGSTYDAANRLVAETDPLGHTTTFVLDAAGRTVGTDYADGSKSSVTLDAGGRVTARTDQDGYATHYQYDALGRLTAVIDALGQTTSYAYDEAGDLVSQTDANGHVTHYEYNGLHERTATVLPMGQRSITTYNAVGEVASTTDFNGATTTYAYDAMGRLTAENFPDGTSVTYVYTADGQRASVTDARGITSYTYDARDRLLSRTDPDGTTISYTYDAAGNRTSVTTPAGTTSYTFDALNRPATVTDPQGGVTRYTYDAASNLTETDFPNGTREVRQYDMLNRLLYVENDGPSGVISSYHYTLSAAGLRTAVVENTGRRVDYNYDGLGRLTNETITDGVAGDRTIVYTYDPVGNRLTMNDSAEGLTFSSYDGNDRLLTTTLNGVATQYTYDNNGNTLSQVTNPTDQTIYRWDSQNRLIEADVTTASGTTQSLYRYDADGIRVSQTTAGQETLYLVDTVQPYAEVLLEYRPGGLIVASYVYGNRLIAQNRGGGMSYYLVDGLGSTRALTNASGVVTDRYVYDAFGRLIAQTGNTVNSYLFAGQQRDAATGLDYLRARYLSTRTGRFVSRDTLNPVFLEPSTLNFYAYVNSNPINRVDYNGRQSSLIEVLTSINTESVLARSIALGAGFGGGTQLFNKFVLGKDVTFGDVLTGAVVGGILGALQGFFVAQYALSVGEAVYVDAITEGLEDSAVEVLVFESVKAALRQAAVRGLAVKGIIKLINPAKIVGAIIGP